MDIDFEVSEKLSSLLDRSYDVAIVGDGSSTGSYGPIGSAGLIIHPPLVREVVSVSNYGSNIESEISTYVECLTKILDYPNRFDLDSDRIHKDYREKYTLLIITDNKYVYDGANHLCKVDNFQGYWYSYFEMADRFHTTVMRADRNSFKELVYVDGRAREAKENFSTFLENG